MTGVSRGIEYPLLQKILHKVSERNLIAFCLASHASPDNSITQRCAWRVLGARKSTYSGQVKLKSYVLTILGEGNSDLQNPRCLVSHPLLVKGQCWYKHKTLSFQYSLNLGQCQERHPAVYFFIMVLTMHGGGTLQSSLQSLSVPPYVRKKALSPERKLKCTSAGMM